MQSSVESSENYEEEHVHSVYEQIASHFSSTRYKPWPIIEKFLNGLAPGSIGLDIGCGNGKYLAVNSDVYIIGSDRSTNLTAIARTHSRHDAVVADALAVPHRPGTVDFAISIAVIHHLSTPDRRIEAVKEVLDVLAPSASTGHGGKALIYVWALEQKSSRRGWDEGDEQDVMVPWVMKVKKKGKEGDTGSGDKTFQRYYHLYRQGELESDIVAAGGKILEAGYEKDNWWAIASRPR